MPWDTLPPTVALQTAGRIAVLLVVAWLLGRAARGVMAPLTRHADATVATLVVTIARVVIGLWVTISALDAVGVDTTALLTSLGVLGLTLGFAAQDTLGNAISGFFILFDRPFVIGDLVQIDGEYGRVDAITLRSVRIITPDGRMVSLPNKTAANAKAISYTNFPHLRLDVTVNVGVEEDLKRVRQLLLAVVADDPAFLRAPAPEVVVTSLGDWFVGMQLRAWLDDERAHLAQHSRLREAVFLALRDAGVDMPYETMAVLTRPAPQAPG